MKEVRHTEILLWIVYQFSVGISGTESTTEILSCLCEEICASQHRNHPYVLLIVELLPLVYRDANL